MAIIVSGDRKNAAAITESIGAARVVPRFDELTETGDELIVVGPDMQFELALQFAASFRHRGLVVVSDRVDAEMLARAIRAGIRQVVPAGDPTALRQACAFSDRNTASRPAGQVITVFGSKGGCGKTTVATNLAAALVNTRRRTCLVDLDLAFGDVAIVLGLSPERTILDAIPMAHTLDAEGVGSLVVEHSSGLHTLLAPIEPAAAEQVTPELVSRLLQQLKEMYEIVVIDSPPAFTENVLAALDLSDQIILLATPDIPAVKNLKLALRTLDQLNSAAERRMLVLNRADAHTGVSAGDVKKLLGTPLHVEIPAHRAVPESINRGVPVVLDQPGNPVSKAIKTLARQLAATAPAPATHAAPQRLFRRKVATA